jgi:hypothetical protein
MQDLAFEDASAFDEPLSDEWFLNTYLPSLVLPSQEGEHSKDSD